MTSSILEHALAAAVLAIVGAMLVLPGLGDELGALRAAWRRWWRK